mmetsp:Transcript_4887/g.10790  ORF Transcript_4887/g.10790 Transcript_4887/m.10790 type:complete len:375 (-) Transcript_4887:548-1672(-)
MQLLVRGVDGNLSIGNVPYRYSKSSDDKLSVSSSLRLLLFSSNFSILLSFFLVSEWLITFVSFPLCTLSTFEFLSSSQNSRHVCRLSPSSAPCVDWMTCSLLPPDPWERRAPLVLAASFVSLRSSPGTNLPGFELIVFDENFSCSSLSLSFSFVPSIKIFFESEQGLLFSSVCFSCTDSFVPCCCFTCPISRDSSWRSTSSLSSFCGVSSSCEVELSLFSMMGLSLTIFAVSSWLIAPLSTCFSVHAFTSRFPFRSNTGRLFRRSIGPSSKMISSKLSRFLDCSERTGITGVSASVISISLSLILLRRNVRTHIPHMKTTNMPKQKIFMKISRKGLIPFSAERSSLKIISYVPFVESSLFSMTTGRIFGILFPM